MRYGRKEILRGVKVDVAKKTWPLPFEGVVSVTSLMGACGWSVEEIEALRAQLFECKVSSSTIVARICCMVQATV